MKSSFSVIFLLLSACCFGQQIPGISQLIQQQLDSAKIPALAVAVIQNGKIVHLSANGYRDLDQKAEATIQTPFHIASVSKTVTNLAVFKLVEAGKLDLNADINNYLPFKVKNPFYPKDKITVRELLNHRSGIRDDYELYGPFWNEPKGDPTLVLADFLKDYLSAKGKLYKDTHFESQADYESFSYSNTGVALLGLIVEQVSGLSYEAFCQKNIFQPLGMNNTSWFLKNFDQQEVAKTYTYSDSMGFQFKGYNGYPDYPAGQLRTSITDFSTLLTGYLNADSSAFILAKSTTDRITPDPRFSQEGYYTWFIKALGNHLYYVHYGGDTGVATVVAIDVVKKSGIAIFANAEVDLGNLLKAIEKQVFSK